MEKETCGSSAQDITILDRNRDFYVDHLWWYVQGYKLDFAGDIAFCSDKRMDRGCWNFEVILGCPLLNMVCARSIPGGVTVFSVGFLVWNMFRIFSISQSGSSKRERPEDNRWPREKTSETSMHMFRLFRQPDQMGAVSPTFPIEPSLTPDQIPCLTFEREACIIGG